mgnify:CR=1 FL=1|jgi:hypothetical protein
MRLSQIVRALVAGMVGLAAVLALGMSAPPSNAGASTTTGPASVHAYDTVPHVRSEALTGSRPAPARNSALAISTEGAGRTIGPPFDRRSATKEVPFGGIGPARNPGAFPGLSTSTSKLQHTFKHAEDFGVTGN